MSDWISPPQAAAAIEHGDGSGVRIAVLDSGIEIGHPDFVGRSLRDDLAVDPARDPCCQPGGSQDRYGHGTALAGVIWDLAPAAEIGSFRVLGPELSARTAAVSLAAREAIERGYHILNCSFACVLPGHLPIYKEWIDQAALAGVNVVAAGSGGSCSRAEWPAHFTSVLGVDSQADPENRQRIGHQGNHLVEFRAHGDEVRVPWLDGGHRVMTGSSFAAAHLTGLLARLLSVHLLRDVHQVKALLRRIAR